jgi:hypothetical protein
MKKVSEANKLQKDTLTDLRRAARMCAYESRIRSDPTLRTKLLRVDQEQLRDELPLRMQCVEQRQQSRRNNDRRSH